MFYEFPNFRSVHWKDIFTVTFFIRLALPEKCPYLEFFWSTLSFNRTKYGPEKLRIWTLFMQITGSIFYYSSVPNNRFPDIFSEKIIKIIND